MACSRRGVFAEGALAVAQRVQQRDVDVLVVVLLGGVGLAQRENALYLTLSPHRHLHDPNAIHQQVLFALTVSTPRLSLEQPRVVHAQVQHHRSVSHTTPPPPLPRDLPTLLLLLAQTLHLLRARVQTTLRLLVPARWQPVQLGLCCGFYEVTQRLEGGQSILQTHLKTANALLQLQLIQMTQFTLLLLTLHLNLSRANQFTLLLFSFNRLLLQLALHVNHKLHANLTLEEGLILIQYRTSLVQMT